MNEDPDLEPELVLITGTSAFAAVKAINVLRESVAAFKCNIISCSVYIESVLH